MYRNPRKLTDEKFDLLIIGGGINGLATAWDATLRGLNVAVIEKGDWGGETSAASLKIIHGGLRYLQHLDFARMRESIRERRNLLHIAPHLIQPFPFLIPTYGHGLKGKEAMIIAMKINDLISADRNLGLQDPDQHLPNAWSISKTECHEYAPFLHEKGLNGGVVFFDGRMHNAERVSLAFAESASEEGATLVNYIECKALKTRGTQVKAAIVRDVLSGETFEIEASIFTFFTGPWSALLTELLSKEKEKDTITKSAGIQIISPCVSKEGMGVGILSSQVNTNTRLKRGGRHYFTTPWRGKTIWGTTEKIYSGNPDDWEITEEDIEEFINELNEILPALQLKREDISYAFGGLRPVKNPNNSNSQELSQKPIIRDHETDYQLTNLISVEGTKFTTCRHLAEKITSHIFHKLEYKPPKCLTEKTPLFGGNFPAYHHLRRQAKLCKPHDLSDASLDYIVRNYGAEYKRIFDIVSRQPESSCLLPGSEEIPEAVILFSVYAEQAVRLSDVVLRRTGAGTLGPPPDAMLERIAEIMFWELSWSQERQREEVALLKKSYTYSSHINQGLPLQDSALGHS